MIKNIITGCLAWLSTENQKPLETRRKAKAQKQQQGWLGAPLSCPGQQEAWLRPRGRGRVLEAGIALPAAHSLVVGRGSKQGRLGLALRASKAGLAADA
jgi:hypothetical protein